MKFLFRLPKINSNPFKLVWLKKKLRFDNKHI